MWDVWGWGEGAEFSFGWFGGILVLFSNCTTNGGNMQLSPVFCGSCNRMSWSLLICLCAAQNSGADRVELL